MPFLASGFRAVAHKVQTKDGKVNVPISIQAGKITGSFMYKFTFVSEQTAVFKTTENNANQDYIVIILRLSW